MSHAATAAVVDSGPSAEARRVLASIPDPLPPGERDPPPARPASVAAAPDTSAEGDGDVPVPVPTRVLGEPNPLALRDSVMQPVEAIDHGVHPATTQTPAGGDSCHRVQFAAKPAKVTAEAMRDAAQSQLSLPMSIETEKGLFKVRTRDCFTRAAADSLRRRALAAGFTGAFRVSSGRRP